MSDDTNLSRRASIKYLTAAGAISGVPLYMVARADDGDEDASVAGGPETVAQTDGPNVGDNEVCEGFEHVLDWGTQGSEHAEQDCPDQVGYWHWILTPGGVALERATLHVTIEAIDNDDSQTLEVDGVWRGMEGRGALHFDVFKAGGGVVTDAFVCFDGGSEERSILTISAGMCVEDEIPPEPEQLFWQVDFAEGDEPPIPPRFWPDDAMCALGDTFDGVEENPSLRRQQTDGQLGDITIVDEAFVFDDDDFPTEVTVEFAVDEDAPTRDLFLAIFELPGPFDLDEIEDQELIDYVSGTFTGGDEDSLTLEFDLT